MPYWCFVWNDGRGQVLVDTPEVDTHMTAQSGLRFLEDRWDDAVASKLDAPELLRYRSNLLGSDLRITNFGGGNTSSKLDQVDPLDGKTKPRCFARLVTASMRSTGMRILHV